MACFRENLKGKKCIYRLNYFKLLSIVSNFLHKIHPSTIKRKTDDLSRAGKRKNQPPINKLRRVPD